MIFDHHHINQKYYVIKSQFQQYHWIPVVCDYEDWVRGWGPQKKGHREVGDVAPQNRPLCVCVTRDLRWVPNLNRGSLHWV